MLLGNRDAKNIFENIFSYVCVHVFDLEIVPTRLLIHV